MEVNKTTTKKRERAHIINVGRLAVDADDHFGPSALLHAWPLAVHLADNTLAVDLGQRSWEAGQHIRLLDVEIGRHCEVEGGRRRR